MGGEREGQGVGGSLLRVMEIVINIDVVSQTGKKGNPNISIQAVGSQIWSHPIRVFWIKKLGGRMNGMEALFPWGEILACPLF